MSRLDKHESHSNVTIEYTLDDQHDVFSWLFWVANSGILQIRRIQLDSSFDEGDKDSDSLVLGKIVSKEKRKELTAQNGMDVLSVIAKFKTRAGILGNSIAEMKASPIRKNI